MTTRCSSLGGCDYSNGFKDRLPFHDFFNESNTEDWFYTNEMLYELFDPQSLTLPYMFDSLSWSHCDGLHLSSSSL